MNDVLANPQIYWSGIGLSRHPNITMRDVLANPQIKWSGVGLSQNPNITFFDVKNNPQIQWNWNGLSGNNMSKGKERYIKNIIQELKIVNEFQLISQSHGLFPNVIEDIIIKYLL